MDFDSLASVREVNLKHLIEENQRLKERLKREVEEMNKKLEKKEKVLYNEVG